MSWLNDADRNRRNKAKDEEKSKRQTAKDVVASHRRYLSQSKKLSNSIEALLVEIGSTWSGKYKIKPMYIYSTLDGIGNRFAQKDYESHIDDIFRRYLGGVAFGTITVSGEIYFYESMLFFFKGEQVGSMNIGLEMELLRDKYKTTYYLNGFSREEGYHHVFHSTAQAHSLNELKPRIATEWEKGKRGTIFGPYDWSRNTYKS